MTCQNLDPELCDEWQWQEQQDTDCLQNTSCQMNSLQGRPTKPVINEVKWDPISMALSVGNSGYNFTYRGYNSIYHPICRLIFSSPGSYGYTKPHWIIIGSKWWTCGYRWRCKTSLNLQRILVFFVGGESFSMTQLRYLDVPVILPTYTFY